MWQEIRKEASLTQQEMGEKTGYTKDRISQYECGFRTMPKSLQIEYLKLRNNEKDKIIIEFLEGEIKNGENFN